MKHKRKILMSLIFAMLFGMVAFVPQQTKANTKYVVRYFSGESTWPYYIEYVEPYDAAFGPRKINYQVMSI
ncbi:MAG: hypothetical protein Q4P29_04995 [Tissierellia bacterium]|nr:hypothetical protein [Tissierellia bacterium]